MKKQLQTILLYSCLALVSITYKGKAQTNFSFENMSQLSGSNMYWNNSAQQDSGFVLNSVYFPCYYDSSFNYWSGGFALSRVSDTSTTGFGNLYGSRAGMGANGSQNYLVGQQNSVIYFDTLISFYPIGVDICNSTYAALSMQNGDMFAKKFGGVTGNDPDYFRILAVAYDKQSIAFDTAIFYLSDFTFSNNSQDYIVEDWQTFNFNFNNQTPVYKLEFALQSSDNGTFGMNTPAFYTLDNLSFNSNSNVENVIKNNELNVYPNPSKNIISIYLNKEYDTIKLKSLEGKTVLVQTENLNTVDVSKLENGLYFLEITNKNNLLATKTIVKN
jgi:hypothetical protein